MIFNSVGGLERFYPLTMILSGSLIIISRNYVLMMCIKNNKKNNNNNFICIAVYTKALYRFTMKKKKITNNSTKTALII